MSYSSKSAICRKPHPDFPLTPRADGRWAKKIKGKVYIFTGTADEAVMEWERVKSYRMAGRTPPPKGDPAGLSVRQLCNQFLNSKRLLLDSGEIVGRTFQDYHTVCERIVEAFGKDKLVDDLAAADFEQLRAMLSKTRGPVAIGNDITRIRMVFKYAFDQGLIDRPIRYGQTFRKPGRTVLRNLRNAKGKRMFEAADILRMMTAASPQVKAMILLGINCGMGNADCGTLPIKALDLKAGWLDFPRPKTGMPRRCPLWPETVDALAAAIDTRPQPKPEAEGLVFITAKGLKWAKSKDDNPVCKETRKILQTLNLHRVGLSFYALRHTFETIGGESRDQVAVDAIMGHAPSSSDMASVYRERISDERLIAVVNHVRGWLFAEGCEVNDATRAELLDVQAKFGVGRWRPPFPSAAGGGEFRCVRLDGVETEPGFGVERGVERTGSVRPWMRRDAHHVGSVSDGRSCGPRLRFGLVWTAPTSGSDRTYSTQPWGPLFAEMLNKGFCREFCEVAARLFNGG